MRVLVACEFSGRVREAFRKLGHDYDYLADQYTQSKLKAFAGEVEKAIGEDEIGATEDFAKKRQSHNNAFRAELRQALKAIKEKAGIE